MMNEESNIIDHKNKKKNHNKYRKEKPDDEHVDKWKVHPWDEENGDRLVFWRVSLSKNIFY